MKISLIVSTYNRPEVLRVVLLSIRQQIIAKSSNLASWEVLIADDGSLSPTGELVASFAKDFPVPLIHVWHPDAGFRLAAIRNLAVSRASGDYLLFIDGDCLLAPDFISQQALLAEPGYFVGGNRVLLNQRYSQYIVQSADLRLVAGGTLAQLWHRLVGHSNKWLANLRLAPGAAWRKRQPTNWRRPKGCNMALGRADFIAVNGFDESFVGWGHEDADFLIRLLHAGVKIKDGRYAAPVYHLWHPMNDRGNEPANLARLHARLAAPELIRAERGFDQYLVAAATDARGE